MDISIVYFRRIISVSRGLFTSKQPFPHGHTLYPIPYKIREHSQGVNAVIVEVLTAYGEQRDLAHEFLILTTSISSIEEIEVFYIRRKLDNTVQLALGGGGFLIAHVYPHSVLAKGFVYNAAIIHRRRCWIPSAPYAEAMILEYNGKKKSTAGKLFMNKLYARDVALWIEPDEEDELEEEDGFESLILGQFGSNEGEKVNHG